MAATQSRGYIFLEPNHPILQDLVKEKIMAYHEPNSSGVKSLEPMDVKIADFDGIYYQVYVNTARPKVMQINLFMNVLKELKGAGADNIINTVYKPYIISSPANNSDLTLELDASSVTADSVEDIATKISLLKQNLLSAPLKRAFDNLLANSSGNAAASVLNVRQDEQIIVQPLSDRVNVTVSIAFAEETDAAIADIFLMEFTDAKRSQSNAPNVKYDRSVPNELRGVAGVKTFKNTVGFMMFMVSPTHVNTEAKAEKVMQLILGLRSYLHYHIKASKAHLHTRMRAKVASFLQVLNRARTEEPERAKKAYRVINY